MRTKSETRRQAILQAATEVFRQSGFERSSMSDIRQRAGCSKPTLYSYFESKEALFVEVVLAATEQEFQATLHALDADQADVGQALESFGQRLLALLYAPHMQALRRLVACAGGPSGLGRRCYEMGPARGEAALAAVLQQAMARGQLRPADPRTAAQHLRGLLEAEWIEPFLFNAVSEPDADQIRDTVGRAVAVFMAAYGPQRVPGASAH